jgi:hypothetical protein
MKFYLYIRSSGHMVRCQLLVSDAGIGARTRSCVIRAEWSATETDGQTSLPVLRYFVVSTFRQYSVLTSIWVFFRSTGLRILEIFKNMLPPMSETTESNLPSYFWSSNDWSADVCMCLQAASGGTFFIRVLNGNWDSDYTNLYFPWSFSTPPCKYLEDT